MHVKMGIEVMHSRNASHMHASALSTNSLSLCAPTAFSRAGVTGSMLQSFVRQITNVTVVEV